MPSLESNLQAINSKDHTADHLDSTMEEYLVWLGEQYIEALRKHTEERIEEFKKEAEKGREAIERKIKQLEK